MAKAVATESKKDFLNPSVPTGPVLFRSRYASLRITQEHGAKLEGFANKRGPSKYITFEGHLFEAKDSETAKHLIERVVEGRKTYGVDYWLDSDTMHFIKQVPKKQQKDTLIKAQESTIARLQSELEALRGGKAA